MKKSTISLILLSALFIILGLVLLLTLPEEVKTIIQEHFDPAYNNGHLLKYRSFSFENNPGPDFSDSHPIVRHPNWIGYRSFGFFPVWLILLPAAILGFRNGKWSNMKNQKEDKS